jgi:hypothetical protein
VDQNDIRDAILLFEYSETVRGGQGPVGKWPAKVLEVLWDLYKSNEIGFRVQRRKSLRGTWRAGRAGYDLQLNPEYINGLPKKERLAALSLLVVHEGMHATVDFTKLYDELAARKLPIYYYRELSGPGVFNEAADPPQPGKQSGIIWIAPGSFPEFQAQSDMLSKDQLLDYVLSIDTYTRSQYLDAKWIIDNLQLWGGLKNRWPSTRGLYIRVLAKTFDPYYTAAILDIMESVERSEDWKEMLNEAGPLHTIQLALDDLNTRRQFSSRIVQLEREWRVRLTEELPRR